MKEDTLNKYLESDDEYYFYCRDSVRKIVPVKDSEKNKAAKIKLEKIFAEYRNSLPKRFIENWKNVKLFENKGNIENADSVLLSVKDGSYCLNNKINHLTGKEWTIFTCSWFIFNALPKDLKEEREVCTTLREHPATYSPTMMENFIKFFTHSCVLCLWNSLNCS